MWCVCTHSYLCVCVFVNLLDIRCIKLSWQLGLSWFFLSRHENGCSVPRICVCGCVRVHETGGGGAWGWMCVCIPVHAWVWVVCVCYEYLMRYSVFMRLERWREAKREEETERLGKRGKGDLNHPTTAYGYYGYNTVVLKCDYGHDGEPACLLSTLKHSKYRTQQGKRSFSSLRFSVFFFFF